MGVRILLGEFSVAQALTVKCCAWVALLVTWLCQVSHVEGQAQMKGFCLPSDYSSTSGDCAGDSRVVSYTLDRAVFPDCEDALGQTSHKMPCTCTPREYARFAVLENDTCTVSFQGSKCSVPAGAIPEFRDHWTNGANKTCDLETRPCTEANLHSVRSKCAVPHAHSATVQGRVQPKFMQVVYYFDKYCDPFVAGSISLPPTKRVPCDHSCPPGQYLKPNGCGPCPLGTFSLGGGIRYSFFNKVDPGIFRTQCTFRNESGLQTCTGWTAKSGVLQAGPFDSPNTMSFMECDDYSGTTCHNKLSASISTTVELVRDGYVKFAYTVSAELGYDGLSFFIDSTTKPVMGIESSQMHPKEVNFSLEAGVHTLTWTYSKDERGTAGQDLATLTFLEVTGTTFSDNQCIQCDPGYFSGGNASECQPCPLNTFSRGGAASCVACEPDQYSLFLPRVNCTSRLLCDVATDAVPTYSACRASTMTRWQEWKWKEPQICLEDRSRNGSSLSPTSQVPCAPCPLGMYYVHNKTSDIASCEFCPPGSYRNDSGMEECLECGQGEAAMKLLTLQHLLAKRDPQAEESQLPEGFVTGCSGDCGAPGWRVVDGYLDSGTQHGPSAVVWLSLTVKLDRDGLVGFNLSVDIPTGDTQRGFFFHIDDYPVQQILDDDYDEGGVDTEPFISGPWPLPAGTHRLMWTWMKVHAPTDLVKRDSAVLYEVVVEGTVTGGARDCHAVPVGAAVRADKSGWDACPPGFFSTGGTAACQPCPANTFNNAPMGGPEQCVECGPGTTSNSGSDECIVGNVAFPTTFCTFRVTSRRASGISLLNPVVFDLSPLYQLHPGQMFGPIYSDPTSPTRDSDNAFFVSVCERDRTNSSCYDYDGNPLYTYACRTDLHTFLEGDDRPGHDVGKSMSVYSLGELDYRLTRRGLQMLFSAYGCPATGGNRSLTLSFICDPEAGYGEPEAWTEGGYAAAMDPAQTFPGWVNRSGNVLPIEGSNDQCQYAMVWYTAFACPVCWPSDLTAVVLPNCPNNTLLTYKFNEPRTCQPNALSPLPKDMPCEPCTASDYTSKIGECKDDQGVHNVTYMWKQPKVCSESLDGAATLPANVVAGPCVQIFFLVPGNPWTPVNIGIVVGLGVAALLLAVFSLRNWLRARRMYREYSKLVQTKGSSDEVELGEGPSTNGSS